MVEGIETCPRGGGSAAKANCHVKYRVFAVSYMYKAGRWYTDVPFQLPDQTALANVVLP